MMMMMMMMVMVMVIRSSIAARSSTRQPALK